MKKITLICLSILICIGLCGCDILGADTSETECDSITKTTDSISEIYSDTESDSMMQETDATTEIESDTEAITGSSLPEDTYKITGKVDQNFGYFFRINTESEIYNVYVNDDIEDSAADLTYGDVVTVYYDGNIVQEVWGTEIKTVYEVVLVTPNNNHIHADFYSSSDVTEKMTFDNGNIYGKLVYKISDTVFVMEARSGLLVKELGKYVCVVAAEGYDFCVGDDVEVEFTVVEKPVLSNNYTRIIADEIYEAMLAAKPIIYFYPESPKICSAQIEIDGKLTCTYPEYGNDGWQDFTAYPDGTLVFQNGKEYYALYWEGIQNTTWDFSKGFCVRGEDTVEFLEWALMSQGLTSREANEFIIYWLPRMQENEYNVISFQTNAYTDTAILNIAPNPDSMLRVFMAYYPSETEVEIIPQEFKTIERVGFTVVEWGGSEVVKP